MTDPKPLTLEELDELARADAASPIPLPTSERVFSMARRCIELEAKQKERDELERRRDEYLCNAEYVGSSTLHHSLDFPDDEAFADEGIKHEAVLYDGHTFLAVKGYGDTYWEALSDALSKLTTEKA